MSIKSTIIAEIQQIAAAENKVLPPLTDDLALSDLSAFDSLAFAILVGRLEETLGLDPFTEFDGILHVVTLGDFIEAYEKSDKAREVDSPQSR
jgi:acyl carrier protein